MSKQDFTAIAVVMDASGSMLALTKDTIGSFNQLINEQRDVPGEAVFSLCIFNHQHELIHDFVPLNDVGQLTQDIYKCTGGTAILDALGYTIDTLGNKLNAMAEEDKPSKVVVVILTDGEENSSQYFTLSQIKSKVDHQTEVYKWQFIFLGANIDAIKAGTSLGVRAANSLNYSATSQGTKQVYGAVSASMASYRSSNIPQVDFFNPNPIAPFEPAPSVITVEQVVVENKDDDIKK